MKLLLMPREPTWWVWLATVLLLAAGLGASPVFWFAAIALSAGQWLYFLRRHRSLRPYSVQIRLAYTLLLVLGLFPGMRWLYWLPTAGTLALTLFGYCLMARVLSLMPWNRAERLCLSLLRRTFLTAPGVGRADHGLPGCGRAGGVCELEAQAALRAPSP